MTNSQEYKQGTCLLNDYAWELQGEAMPGAVLRALASIIPLTGCTLMVEGSSIASDIEAKYKRLRCAGDPRVPRDNLSNKAQVHYVKITPEELRVVAALFDTRSGCDIADHLKIYDGEGVLFSWHDICMAGWPVTFSERLGEDGLRRLQKEHGFDICRKADVEMRTARQYSRQLLIVLNLPAMYYLSYPIYFAAQYNTAFKHGDMPSVWVTLLASPVASVLMIVAIVYTARHTMPRILKAFVILANVIALLPSILGLIFVGWWIIGGGISPH